MATVKSRKRITILRLPVRVKRIGELQGDVNGDWVVDDRDIDTVEATWGSDYAQTDVDGDGTVGTSDLNLTPVPSTAPTVVTERVM